MKCAYTNCDDKATQILKPTFLKMGYCKFHAKIVKSWARNNLGGNYKRFSNIEQLNFVRVFIEVNNGVVGDWSCLYELFLRSHPKYSGPLRDDVFFRVCLTRLNIPCVTNLDVNNGLLYCCIDPCLFVSDVHNKSLGNMIRTVRS